MLENEYWKLKTNLECLNQMWNVETDVDGWKRMLNVELKDFNVENDTITECPLKFDAVKRIKDTQLVLDTYSNTKLHTIDSLKLSEC